MTTKPNQSIAEQLLTAQRALDGALNSPEILSSLANYGYTVAVLEEGQTLYQQAQSLTLAQSDAYAGQYQATQIEQEARQLAHKKYLEHLQLARLAFRGKQGPWNALSLAGARKRTLAGWLLQARQFYQAALTGEHAAEIQAGLAKYNLTADRLQAGLDLVLAVEAANSVQDHRRGKAQDATQDRNLVLAELNSWLVEFRTVARIALQEDPQYLEKLGILVAS